MEIGAISKISDPGAEHLLLDDNTSTENPDLDEGLIAAFGKSAARKTSRYPPTTTKPKAKRTNKPPLSAKKIREREERQQRAIFLWGAHLPTYQQVAMEARRGLQYPARHLPHPGQGSIKTTSMPIETYELISTCQPSSTSVLLDCAA